MIIAIQPSYGNPAAIRHFHDTLERDVDFTAPPLWTALSPPQRQPLRSLHPDGHARFWGGTANQGRLLDELTLGDVILFTGKGHIQGIGEFGVGFDSPTVGDLLWSPHPTNGTYRHVYTLRSFTRTLLPNRTLQDAIGSSHNDSFQGLRLLRDTARVDAVTIGLGIRTRTAADEELAAAQNLAATLASEQPPGSSLVAAEQLHTASGTYTPAQRDIEFRRVEALLVESYIATLPPAADHRRVRCQAGLTDLYVIDPPSYDLVEAKCAATHHHIRTALGQLLDYTYGMPDMPITTLTLLVPERPADPDLALLYHYGIDCLYRSAPGQFRREPAPSDRQGCWRPG